jgi:hypothetical protein
VEERRDLRLSGQWRRGGQAALWALEERRTGGSVVSGGVKDRRLSGQWRRGGQAAQWAVEERRDWRLSGQWRRGGQAALWALEERRTGGSMGS